jgi:hypothetical protein
VNNGDLPYRLVGGKLDGIADEIDEDLHEARRVNDDSINVSKLKDAIRSCRR